MPKFKTIAFAPKLRAFEGTYDSIERRFRTFLQTTRLKLRVRVQEALEDERADAVIAGQKLPGLPPYRTTELTYSDNEKIKQRVQRILKARETVSGLRHLKAEMAARLRPVIRGVELVGPANEHEADEIVAQLFEEMPWHGQLIEILWRDMRQGARDGEGLRFRPTLMDGAPGVGKTHLALRLAELARVPFAYVDVATSSEGFTLSGTQRTWSSAAPGRPVETILDSQVGNPLIFVDEVEKGGTHYSQTYGTATSAHQALLSLVEPASARVWVCPILRNRVPHGQDLLARGRQRHALAAPALALAAAHRGGPRSHPGRASGLCRARTRPAWSQRGCPGRGGAAHPGVS
jgi:hypothetical protein